jgi:hypothetical protein
MIKPRAIKANMTSRLMFKAVRTLFKMGCFLVVVFIAVRFLGLLVVIRYDFQ